MNARRQLAVGMITGSLVLLGASAIHGQAQDKYALQVPGGLGFAEFKGYESWQTIGVSRSDKAMAVILGNPEIVAAYESGIPGNGKPFPDGARMAKIHWAAKPSETFSGPIVHGEQIDVDFMVKDNVRFGDSGGWGYAVFRFDPASGSFTPGTEKDHPPQANDAKCGVACHTVVKSRDYVFTDYAPR